MIELTNETSYPQSLVRILQDNVPHLECCVNAVYNGSFQKDAVVDQVMEIISVSGFCGYHYSKCIPSEIRSEGLKLLNGQSHRDDFIRKYSNLFSFSDCEKIKSDWVDYYRSQHGREGKLWFIGNMVEPSNGNVSNLLKYFGGEAIYMGLLRDENTHILSALENIGKSCIIKILIKDIHKTLNNNI